MMSPKLSDWMKMKKSHKLCSSALIFAEYAIFVKGKGSLGPILAIFWIFLNTETQVLLNPWSKQILKGTIQAFLAAVEDIVHYLHHITFWDIINFLSLSLRIHSALMVQLWMNVTGGEASHGKEGRHTAGSLSQTIAYSCGLLPIHPARIPQL